MLKVTILDADNDVEVNIEGDMSDPAEAIIEDAFEDAGIPEPNWDEEQVMNDQRNGNVRIVILDDSVRPTINPCTITIEEMEDDEAEDVRQGLL